jgi:hypothetical protein
MEDTRRNSIGHSYDYSFDVGSVKATFTEAEEMNLIGRTKARIEQMLRFRYPILYTELVPCPHCDGQGLEPFKSDRFKTPCRKCRGESFIKQELKDGELHNGNGAAAGNGKAANDTARQVGKAPVRGGIFFVEGSTRPADPGDTKGAV